MGKTKAVAIYFALLFLFSGCNSKEKRYEEQKFIFDTYIQIIVYDKSESHAKNSIAKAFQEIERVDAKYNSKTKGSLFDKFNNQNISEMKFDETGVLFLKKAEEYFQLSDKKYDITIFPLMDMWGFFQEKNLRKNLPSSKEISDAKKYIGYEKIQINVKNNFVKKNGRIKMLDTGSFLKGYALQRAKEILVQEGITSGFLSSVSSIITIGTKPNNIKWKVGIQEPSNPNEILGTVELQDEALGVSGDYQTYVEIDGKKYHHIIDKNTGYPISDKKMVIVITSDGMEADFLSTTFFLMKEKDIFNYARKSSIKCLIIDSNMSIKKTNDFFIESKK
ncbi:MAG: FAD:protein FMN transferase [Fusobacteriaceae bacterium]